MFFKVPIWYMKLYIQCLGSGSVGSARFWFPGSWSAKICGSTDPRGKILTKNCKENPFLLLKPKSELLKKREIIKVSSFLNGFRIKISEKKSNLKIIFCYKNSVNLKEITWIRILFFQVRIQDPDPDQN